MSDPMDHVRKDSPRREQIADIVDDWMTHCHGVKAKVIGLMAAQIDNQAEVVKALSSEHGIMFKILKKIYASDDIVEIGCLADEAIERVSGKQE